MVDSIEVKMDFLGDIVQIAKDDLDKFDVQYEGLDDRGVLECWVNVNLKLVTPMPRRVVKSDKFLSSPFSDDIVKGLDCIEEKLVKGLDVNPHQSKTIIKPGYTDALFADWYICHFHINTEIDGNYFIKRSGQLLFAIIIADTAYFIDVRSHNEAQVFAQRELYEIAERNWPDLFKPYKLHGVTGLSQNIEDSKDIKKLRDAGINVFQKIGDNVYAPPGGGVSIDRTSLHVTREVDRLYKQTRGMEEFIENNLDQYHSEISKALGHVPNNLELQLISDSGEFHIIEKLTKTRLFKLQQQNDEA